MTCPFFVYIHPLFIQDMEKFTIKNFKNYRMTVLKGSFEVIPLKNSPKILKKRKCNYSG